MSLPLHSRSCHSPVSCFVVLAYWFVHGHHAAIIPGDAGHGSTYPAGVIVLRRRTRLIRIQNPADLRRACEKCHGAKKQEGGLRLDQKSGWARGGDQGPAIVPGKPEESLLVKAVRYTTDDLQMPPSGKLPEREIAALVDVGEAGCGRSPRRRSRQARWDDPHRGEKLLVVTTGEAPAHPSPSAVERPARATPSIPSSSPGSTRRDWLPFHQPTSAPSSAGRPTTSSACRRPRRKSRAS